MKFKNYFALVFLFLYQFLTAQVGIGTTNPYSQLDVRSTNQAAPANNDGILIPKIDTFPGTNPTASQQGMLVYLTTTATFGSVSKSPGFYYWDNTTTNWIGIQTSSSSEWNLLGNTGTAPATNFIGTTDDKDVVFKRFGVRAGFIGDPYFAPISFNYNNGNTSFGANSMLNPTINIGAQTGVRNSAFGVNVMPSLTSGYNNIGIGDFALYSNTSGHLNIAIGSGALYTNSTAKNNVAIGRNTLTSSNSDNNTAVGNAALRQNASGTNNTAIGFESLRNTLGSGNIGIGYQAGFNETGSDKLYIENSNADANNALIYGEFNTNIVRVNGGLQIGNQSTTGYNFPTARGINGQVLQTDGTGNVSWAHNISNLSVMRSRLSANLGLGTGGWQKIVFNTTDFDSNTELNTGTGTFTASKTGYYEVNAGFHTNDQGNLQFYSIGVYKNGVLYQQTSGNHSNLGPVVRNINCIVSLTVGQTIEIFAENYQSGVTIDSYLSKTFFEVKQIK